MGQVVVYLIRVVEGVLQCLLSHLPVDLFVLGPVVVIVLGVALLDQDLGTQLFQELVSLAQQLFDFIAFLQLDQLEVGLVVLLLEGFEPFLGLLVLYHVLLFFLHVVDGLGLVDELFAVFLLLAVPLEELLLVHSQVLHELLVLYLLAPLMVGLHLVLHLLHPVPLVAVFLQFFPPEIAPVQQLLLEQPDRLIIIFDSL